MNNKKLLTVVAMLSINLVGCATITHDSTQSVQVSTLDKTNQKAIDAQCTLKNERGEWKVTGGGAVAVHRSSENLLVKCTKDGYEDGKGTLVSRANGGMWGNILLGGGVGAIVDHEKGTAYNYPDWVNIMMGEDLIFDRKNQHDNQPLTGNEPELTKEVKK